MFLLLIALTACSSVSSDAETRSSAPPATATDNGAPAVAAPEPVAAQPATAPEAVPPASERAETPELAAAASCKFGSLELFTGRTVKWEGECVGGKAHGKGALRAYPKAGSGDKEVLIFFGQLDKGDPTLGVVETPDGYIAGEFRAGQALDSDDPNVTLRAFRVATDAATLVSERMKTAGNAGSAAFYAKKAGQLQQQMN